MQISERIQVRLGQIIHSKYFQLKNFANKAISMLTLAKICSD